MAKTVTPPNSTTIIQPIIIRVMTAFLDSGFLNIVTPLLIASTPVKAVDPDENALNKRNRVTPPGSAAEGISGMGGCPFK